jgi:hypothetical protein
MVAHAEILALCGRAAHSNLAAYGNIAPIRLIEAEAANTPSASASVALLRDANGFDVVMNWGEENSLSLRAQGADITGNEMGPDFIDLIVFRANGRSLEHFLFNLDDHAGELIWNTSDEALQDKEEGTLNAVCVNTHR